nr:unnamed protein product [Callosobruchus chinensis]
MTTTPSTIVVFTEDKVNFPTKYGVKDMSISGDRVFISLTYSPRTPTLKRKLGNLPVRYMKVRIDKDEDFKILERVVRRYRFNLLDEQVEDIDNSRIEGGKRKFYLQPPPLLSDDHEEDDDDSDSDNDDNGGGSSTDNNVNQDGAVAAAAAAPATASTSTTATVAAAAGVDKHSANDDDAIVNLDDFEFHLDK